MAYLHIIATSSSYCALQIYTNKAFRRTGCMLLYSDVWQRLQMDEKIMNHTREFKKA